MSGNRKLASVQRIESVEPIEDADRIELAHILGWQCVVNKNQFRPGDLCVYFEIDSFLPIRAEFEFMRASSYKNSDLLGEGFRLKTMKFRGQLSQGLALPVSVFSELGSDLDVGADVTDALGVRKWEIEERATTGDTVVGQLPRDVPHTDETRIQAEPDLLEAFRGKEYYVSTKMDGSSHSISLDEDGFHVTGHNYEYKDDGVCSFYNLVHERNYRQAMERYMAEFGVKTLTIQGEFCGPGVQKNRLKLRSPEWYVFTVRIDGQRVGLEKTKEVAAAIGAPTVPIEEVGFDLPSVYPTVDALLERANGAYPNGGAKEGIVIRTVEPEYCALLSAPLSMKVVSNKYLLKNE
ncbi:MAG: hypothetical protein IK077_14770 [Thermoguttaceae bacterium]|nr:hypothetical protein [Thermoguttaceae bacterium]